MRLLRLPASWPLVFVCTAAFTLSASSASALTAVESACHDEIAKATTKYAGTVAKTIARCHALRSGGDLPLDVDCNTIAGADPDGRLSSARSRALGDILDECQGAGALLSLYESCPAPAASVDDGGSTTGTDDFTEVALCMLALTDARVTALSSAAQGNPDDRLLEPLRRCQGGLGKGTGRIVKTIMRERRRCQASADRLGGTGAYSCNTADPTGRIQKESSKYASKTTSVCTFQESVLERIGACDDEVSGLVACSSSSASQHGAALIRNAYQFDGSAGSSTTTTTTTLDDTTTTTIPGSGCGSTFPQCDGTCPLGSQCVNTGEACGCESTGTGPCAPATIIREIISRYSTEVNSVTSLNAGWSGLAFDLDVPDRSRDMVDVVCDDNCENCQVSLHREPNGNYSGCNCTANPEQGCGVINGSDPDNCGSIDPTCRCYFGAPLPIAASGIPACVPMRMRSSNAGTMNLRTGEWHDIIDLAAVVYLGIESTAPCPTCNGDPVANDNVRGGTCSGGLGGACDANGTHPTYGTTSNDCLPATAANISGTGLLIKVPLTTDSSELHATLPCDTPEGQLCHCRTCTGNSNKSCNSDAECDALGAGECTASGGAGVRLNQCDGFLCSADGTCTTGPVDFYCDGAVFPDGSGYIPCQSNSDCGGNGACTIPQFRRCFPDPTIFDGDADVTGPTSVSTFCVAPTSNPAINIGAGLPGPGALLIRWDNDVRCKSNPDVPYEFPSGANCETFATTTTTLLPIPECEDAESPVCGGLCPVGSVCTDNAGSCECTGLPLPSCGSATAPSCGGICPNAGEVCMDSGGTCTCAVVTLPQCDGADAPLCGGLCPTGELCQSVGDTCECGAVGVPSCTSALAPVCGGLCDPGQACIASNDTCICTQLPVPTCAEATGPLCAGTCALGSLCQDAGGGACQCTLLPLP